MGRVNERKLQLQIQGFVARNTKFRDREEFEESLYEKLESEGFDISTSTLISWFPDDPGSCVVDLIRQDGRVFRLMLDKENPQYDETEEITSSFKAEMVKNKQKPWNSSVIAWRYHRGELEDDSSIAATPINQE